MYGKLIVSMSKNRRIVDCLINLQPTEQSRTYTVRILYKEYGRPKVWLMEPELETYEGKKPHHLYGEDKDGNPELCVYDPKQDKWNSRKSLAGVFIPWVITWLYAYEMWLITGEWLYPEVATSKNENGE